MGADQHAQLYRLFYVWPFRLVLLFLMMTATRIDTMKQICILFHGQLSCGSSFWYSTNFPWIPLVLVFFWSLKRAFLLASTIPWTIRGGLGPWSFYSTDFASTASLHLFLKQYQTFILACCLIKRLINLSVYLSTSHSFRCDTALLTQSQKENFGLFPRV